MKRFLIFCLLAICLCFAQNPWILDTSSGGTSPATPEPEAKPKESEIKPKAPLSVFDSVRGHGYNPFSIAGAASSVTDLVTTPSDIYGKKFFYVSPTDKLGYASFELFGGSALLGLSNQFNEDGEPLLASLILGYATSAFGVALEYSVGKMWTTEIQGPVTQSSRITYPGDNIGLYFSMPLGSATTYANVNWLTYELSGIKEIEGAASADGWTKIDYSTIDANAGLLGNLGALNYDVYLNVERHGGTMTSSYFSSMGEKVVTDSSYLAVSLNINIGYAALQNETARVIVGSNNMIGAAFLDEIDPGEPSFAGGSTKALIISPNILGEVIFANSCFAFAGAKHDINFIFEPETPRDENSSETIILQANLDKLQTGEIMGTEAFIGIRYQKPNWALEAQVSANPFKALAGDNIFANFGGFIYF